MWDSADDIPPAPVDLSTESYDDPDSWLCANLRMYIAAQTRRKIVLLGDLPNLPRLGNDVVKRILNKSAFHWADRGPATGNHNS